MEDKIWLRLCFNKIILTFSFFTKDCPARRNPCTEEVIHFVQMLLTTTENQFRASNIPNISTNLEDNLSKTVLLTP